MITNAINSGAGRCNIKRLLIQMIGVSVNKSNFRYRSSFIYDVPFKVFNWTDYNLNVKL